MMAALPITTTFRRGDCGGGGGAIFFLSVQSYENIYGQIKSNRSDFMRSVGDCSSSSKTIKIVRF
jgi:hypothetical protein